MKKFFWVLVTFLLPIVCYSKPFDTEIEYYLINIVNNESFIDWNLSDNDSVKFQRLKDILSTSDNYYKLGSAIYTGNNGSSYHRIFEHKIFGYFELSAKYQKELVRFNSNSVTIKFSILKDSSALDEEGHKIVYPKNRFFTRCIEIDSDMQLMVLISPTDKAQNEQSVSKYAPLQNWIRTIVIEHQIDSLQTRHIPSDPAVMAFCNTSRVNKKAAIIKNAKMLINEGNTYLIITANKIRQKANNPLTWIRGWDQCEILVRKGTVERYSFSDSDISKLDSWEKEGEIIKTRDITGAEITINID